MSVVADLLFIFFLRLLDVGMSTVRIVLLGRGRKGPATALGFFESLVWVIAVARVLNGLDDPARMVAFALGFAAGTYVGSMVEEWLAIGDSLVRVIAPVGTPEVAGMLRDQGFGATVINGDGLNGDVRLTFTVVPRKRLKWVAGAIQRENSDAFVTVDQTARLELSALHDRDVER